MSSDNNKNGKNVESDEKQDVSRREFIKYSGIAAGGIVSGGLLVSLLRNPIKSEETSKSKKEKVNYIETRYFFKRKEDFDVLSVATEKIFPENDLGPGAIELGVPYFIDKQLAGEWGYNAKMYMKKPFQKDETPLTKSDMFLQGVRKIEQTSKEKYDSSFIDLEEKQQNEILSFFETDEIEMNNVSSALFFTTLIQSTLEGAYSDPMYGGNKDMKGWAMKEYPGPRMSHRDKVEEGFEVYKEMERKSLKTHM